MRAVVGSEFTEGFLHIVSHSCVSPKDGAEHKDLLCVYNIQEQGSAHSSEHPWLFPLSLYELFMTVSEEKQDLSNEEGGSESQAVTQGLLGWQGCTPRV